MQNLGQSGPKNFFLRIACSKFVPKSIHQIARFHFQKYKIFQLLRGTPPVRACTQLALTGYQIAPNVEDGSTPLKNINKKQVFFALT